VYIKFSLAGETVYENIVNEGNIITVPISGNFDSLVVEINALNDDLDPGALLQSMIMSVQCREEDALVLYDTFGSLQLTGYRNEEQGLQSVYTTVNIQYTVTNTGSEDAVLIGAVKTNPISGMEALIPEGETVLLAPDTQEVYSDVFTFNLGTLVGVPLEFNLLTQEEDPEGGDVCEDFASYTVLVQM